MSARQLDYESLRELQARSQVADRIGPNPERNDREADHE